MTAKEIATILTAKEIEYLRERVLTLQPINAGGQWAGHKCHVDSFADDLMERLAGTQPGPKYGIEHALTFTAKNGKVCLAVESLDLDMDPDQADQPEWDFAFGINSGFVPHRVNLVTIRRVIDAYDRAQQPLFTAEQLAD